MAHMLRKIRDALSNRTTYRLGMLHTRVYRLLNQQIAIALKPYSLTPPEWAMLGVLYDMPDGVRFSTIADEVGVEPPFVTVMAKKLIRKKLAVEKQDPSDSRAKLICISPTGRKQVPKIEKVVRSAMRPIVGDVSAKDLLSYISVLTHIAYADAEDVALE
jgi:MarR family transcriptional regulator, transcriptional regulator for hemolysin